MIVDGRAMSAAVLEVPGGLAPELFYLHPRLHAGIRARGLRVPAPDDPVPDAEPAVAYVDAGRWIADCPGCAGAEYVWLDAPRFWCAGCGNAAIGGGWRPVALPASAGEIAAVLLRRPDPATRNWRGEPVADLRAENDEHGLSGPEGNA